MIPYPRYFGNIVLGLQEIAGQRVDVVIELVTRVATNDDIVKLLTGPLAGLNWYSDHVNAVTNRGQADVLGRPTIATGLDCPTRPAVA